MNSPVRLLAYAFVRSALKQGSGVSDSRCDADLLAAVLVLNETHDHRSYKAVA